MKKILALVLAMMMVLTMGVAFAADGTTTYGITINKDTTDKVAHTYGAYQLFKGELDEKDGKAVLSNIQWGDNVTPATVVTELKKISTFADLADDASAAAVAKAISDANLAKDSDGAKAVADAFAAAITGSAKGTVNIAADATTGGTISGLVAGYYLVKDDDDVSGEGAQTRYILEVVKDVEVTEKASVPTVTKKVKEKNDTTGTETGWQDAADYDIGDEIPYKLEGTLPSKFADYKTFKTYTFTDTLSDGLTPPAAADVNVTLDTETGTDLSGLFDVAVSGQVITISLKRGADLKASTNPTFTKDSKIIVTYSATLNDKAKIGSEGNPNTVKLDFSNNPNFDGEGDDDHGTTPEDKVIVFTYEIKALKVEPNGAGIDAAAYEALTAEQKAEYVKIGDKYFKTKALEGAGFTLYKKEGSDYVAVGEEIKGVTTFEFKGTDAGEYKLVETTVPGGYNKCEDIVITVTATYDTEAVDPKLTSLTVTPADFAVVVTQAEGYITTDGVITGKVVNQSGATLPETGGVGTTIFYIAGSILVLAAAILLVTKRRMGSDD